MTSKHKPTLPPAVLAFFRETGAQGGKAGTGKSKARTTEQARAAGLASAAARKQAKLKRKR